MTQTPTATISDSAAARQYLVDALRIDLIGPRLEDTHLQEERLPQAPSRWYLTGFLVPTGAPPEQKAQDTEEEMDSLEEVTSGSDDSSAPERGSSKRNFLPSSIGLSILVDDETRLLDVSVQWGDYIPGPRDSEDTSSDKEEGLPTQETDGMGKRQWTWIRRPREGNLSIDLATVQPGKSVSFALPNSDGLEVAFLARPTTVRDFDGERTVRAVSIFAVNRRKPVEDRNLQDAAFAFQVEMSVTADRPLVSRPNPHGLSSEDWDERLSDLHYRDVAEYATGHNVSSSAEVSDGECNHVRTEWMPQATVERTEPEAIEGVEFSMEALGSVADADTAKNLLNPMVSQYRAWIDSQKIQAQQFTGRRREIADELVSRASRVATRIEAGINMLDAPNVLEAFRISNRAMAASGRRRRALEQGVTPNQVPAPAWRPFQLAYLLMNLRGIADPTHVEREFVDLLFFPTGGGKTEAYLGLAAFTIVLRRLENPGPAYRGLSVLMRYTLRLLTLDQLGRAAALICALELEREQAMAQLGDWPFEIALWVGRAATPNYMGRRGDRSGNSARVKTLKYTQDSSLDPPVPLEQCPWCGSRFTRNSFRLDPNTNEPKNLFIECVERKCDFHGSRRHLPIVAVDEPIYDRMPCFMIATADKFAALPWTGETARFFRGGDADNPIPPDLIIQDELHLISGPLGTMAGLYETAIDHLCTRRVGDKLVRPKIIASTATARLASKQIQALFDRRTTEVFPTPGIDRRNSFFAKQVPVTEVNGRLYLGIAALGRGPRVVFLRATTTLMAAAKAAGELANSLSSSNPADPYLTTVAYFNALRELGSARRIVEDEISSRLLTYSQRKRLNETQGVFSDRQISVEPVELTSRVGTAQVAEAKRRLALPAENKDSVDVALATNMISVGLDITRLGLMVVAGQPKTTSEYIQATSRVGRDASRPGLVVTLLNIHKPRDRSHYERYSNYHESFYRNVEATSVTPFSPRAMDRALPAVSVALSRLGILELTPSVAAAEVELHDKETREIAKAVGERAQRHTDGLPQDFGAYVTSRVQSLLDDWAMLARNAGDGGVTFGYSRRDRGVSTPLLREMIDPDRNTLNETQLRFRAPRSLRDVEPSVLLAVKTPEGNEIS